MVKSNRFGARAAAWALGALGLLVLMLVVEVRPAEAAFPGANGRIAYVRSDGNDFEIFTIPATGGTGSQVTFNDTDEESPAYSPDGNRIAYQGEEIGKADEEIFTIPANGGTPVQVTYGYSHEREPAYSPDGSRIFYSDLEPWSYYDYEILSLPATGGYPPYPYNHTANSGDDFGPSSTAQGNKIAYSSFDGHDNEIFTKPAYGGTPVQVTNNDSNDATPDYSPNGNAIVFSRFDGNDHEIFRAYPWWGSIWIQIQLTNNNTADMSPVFSPDGQQIAYSGYDGNDYEIFRIPAAGGTPVQVTINTTRNEYTPSWQPLR